MGRRTMAIWLEKKALVSAEWSNQHLFLKKTAVAPFVVVLDSVDCGGGERGG